MRLTNLDRVVFPQDGITKGDVVTHYEAVAPRMLPHVSGRPLSLERFRGTIDDGSFFQQQVSAYFPDLVGRAEVAGGRKGTVVHPVADTPGALVYLANQGALTLHAWPARAADVEHPDLLVLDLDPPGEDFAPVREAAAHVRSLLEELGLSSLPMTTGSRGVHVLVPVDGTLAWDELWQVAKGIGAALVKRAPTELTRAFYKSQRRDRLYVDTGRARRGSTSVVPYTVRARPGAPVAAPVAWDELLDPAAGVHARWVTLRTVLDRPEDPWDGGAEARQSLAAVIERLGIDLHPPAADGPVMPHNRPR